MNDAVNDFDCLVRYYCCDDDHVGWFLSMIWKNLDHFYCLLRLKAGLDMHFGSNQVGDSNLVVHVDLLARIEVEDTKDHFHDVLVVDLGNTVEEPNWKMVLER